MNSEQEKAVEKLKVRLTAKPLPTTPARGLPAEARCYRVTLARKIGRGETATELKLTTVAILEGELLPSGVDMVGQPLYLVLDCLIEDARAGLLTYWDFEQTYSGRLDKLETEGRHNACKKLGSRVRKFFGEAWPLVNGEKPAVAKADKKERGEKVRKSA